MPALLYFLPVGWTATVSPTAPPVTLMVVYLSLLLVPPLGLPVAIHSSFRFLNMAGTSCSSVAVVTGFLNILRAIGSSSVAPSIPSQESRVAGYADPPTLFSRHAPVGTACPSILSRHNWEIPRG